MSILNRKNADISEGDIVGITSYGRDGNLEAETTAMVARIVKNEHGTSASLRFKPNDRSPAPPELVVRGKPTPTEGVIRINRRQPHSQGADYLNPQKPSTR